MTQGLVAAAVERWLPAGISPAQAAAIRALPIQIRDLPGDMLCAITSTRIPIDTAAAGRGWFADASPWEDAEFVVGTRPTGIDLLTVLTHEVGRQLGLTNNNRSILQVVSRLERGAQRRVTRPKSSVNFSSSMCFIRG